jgi:hypothetical protein
MGTSIFPGVFFLFRIQTADFLDTEDEFSNLIINDGAWQNKF